MINLFFHSLVWKHFFGIIALGYSDLAFPEGICYQALAATAEHEKLMTDFAYSMMLSR